MHRMENLGRRIPCVLMAAAVGLSGQPAAPKREVTPSRKTAAFRGLLRPREPEETTQGNPSSGASSLQESAPEQPEKDTFSLAVSSQSSAVESTLSPEPSGLAAEDFSSSEGTSPMWNGVRHPGPGGAAPLRP